MKSRLSIALFSLAAAGLLLSSISAVAATKAERAKLSDELVQEALHREVYGLGQDREALLEEALKNTPNHEEANWHSGHVNENGKWVDYREHAEHCDKLPRLAEYRRLRSETADDIPGNMALAIWCDRNKLDDQRRAHLTRVIELSPDHAEARRGLGHLQVDGEWLSVEERRERAAGDASDRKSLAKWRPTMLEIRRGLTRKSVLHNEAAKDRLLKIDDIAAIGAMEEVLSPVSAAAGNAVVESLARMPKHEAAVALARQAVYSPFEETRTLAAEKLSQRPKEDYVPHLLSTLTTPIVTRSQFYAGRGGRLVCRHEMLREGQDQRELTVFETEYNRVARPGGDREDSLERAVGDAAFNARARGVLADRQNSRTQRLNFRVMNVLEESTGQVMPPTPQNWWTWWEEENEVFATDQKPVRQIVRREVVNVVDRSTNPTGPTGQTGPPQVATPLTRFSGDCLAAGTPVWTDRGLVAIEAIKIGDRVLAQDPETGELAYKPVLGTTIRPASRLVRIEAVGEKITTSGGHLFWTSGDGWQKARELVSGSELHSVNGTIRVSSVEEAELAPTYNLIVADFHTYFVGETMVFCHDNTIRQSTNAVVPGLTDY